MILARKNKFMKTEMSHRVLQEPTDKEELNKSIEKIADSDSAGDISSFNYRTRAKNRVKYETIKLDRHDLSSEE